MKNLTPESKLTMYVLFVGLDSTTDRDTQKTAIQSITESHFESYTMQYGVGCFRETHEHTFLIYVAASDEQQIINLAKDIRSKFDQEGVGYVQLGTYNRVLS